MRFTRSLIVALCAILSLGLVLIAQDAPEPGQQPQPAPAGRGGRGRGGAGRGRAGGFTQFTRPLAPQDVIVRGQALYQENCSTCHNVDLRGSLDRKSPNLLTSGVALRDQHGELIAIRLTKHNPPITLQQADTTAIAEYIHSVLATMGGQGSPPGRIPQGITLNVLVGDPHAGETTFKSTCGSCHSVTGDLEGFANKFDDPRTLQNAWVSGSLSLFGGGGGGGRGGAQEVPATLTFADGSKLDGTLLREDDFLLVMQLPDGTRRSMARANGFPKVELKNPKAGHVDAIVKLAHDDKNNKMMHDITAYLWSTKQ